MNNGKKMHILKHYNFERQCGKMFLNGLGVEKYTHKKTGNICLIFVTTGGKWIGHYKIDSETYEHILESSFNSASFLATLLDTFFGCHMHDDDDEEENNNESQNYCYQDGVLTNL